MTDVLASPYGVVGSWRDMDAEWEQQIPVFFSNPDLLWVRSVIGSVPYRADDLSSRCLFRLIGQ